MTNIPKSSHKPWNVKGESMPWNPKDESGKPFANAKRYNESFYQTGRWRNVRNHYIKTHPLCAQCERDGKTVLGYFVDHIIPLSQGGEPIMENNFQTLCRKCHASKTNKEIANNKKK